MICASTALADGGDGVEFEVLKNDELLPAFAIRFDGVVYAYVNRCSHMDFKLNFLHRDFLDVDRDHLICSTHGARYDPVTGTCRSGPCDGTGLVPIAVQEVDGMVEIDETGTVVSQETGRQWQ